MYGHYRQSSYSQKLMMTFHPYFEELVFITNAPNSQFSLAERHLGNRGEHPTPA